MIRRKTISDAYYALGACVGLTLADVGTAMGQVDPSAPLDVLQRGREKAASSNLNFTQLEATSNSLGNAIMVIGGVIGVGGGLYSAYQLYQASTNENSRQSSTRALAGIGVSGVIAVFGVILGLVTNAITN